MLMNAKEMHSKQVSLSHMDYHEQIWTTYIASFPFNNLGTDLCVCSSCPTEVLYFLWNPTLSDNPTQLWPQSIISESSNLKCVRLTVLKNQLNTSFRYTINKQSLHSSLASALFWSVIFWDGFSTGLVFNGFSETHRKYVNRVKGEKNVVLCRQ